MTPANVPIIGLETSHTSSRSSNNDDQISFKMVDELQSICSGNAHSPSRPPNLPLHGCQSFRLGSSSRTDESIPSWSLVGRPIPAPYQHVGNNGHSFRTDKNLKYIRHSCVMISTDNTTVVSYINKQGRMHSPDLCVQVWKILLWCLKHQIVVRIRHFPGRFNVLADKLSRIDKVVKTEWAMDQSIVNSIFQMFNYPNLDLFATSFNHKLPLYVSPVLDNQAFTIDAFSMNWNHIHAYAFSPTILIPSVLNKIRQSQCRIVLIAALWPQQAWFSEVLQLLVSAPVCLPLVPNLLNQGKLHYQNLPSLSLHAWELSNNQLEIKNFRKTLQILSPNQDEHQLRKYMMWNGLFIPVGVIQRKKVNPVSDTLTVIAHFLIYLFSEKKYQISTIKGYRSMISNTLKFKTDNRIGSNPVLSELIRSFELQRPVQRSLTPKLDLSWVLICLQKAPYEPLHKASKLHVTLKTVFLLALATAEV